MAEEQQKLPERPDPLTPPSWAVDPRSGSGACVWAVVLGGLAVALGVFGLLSGSVDHAASTGVLLSGALLLALGAWGVRRRLPALYLLVVMVGLNTAGIFVGLALALRATPAEKAGAGVALVLVGMLAGAGLSFLVFLLGFLRAAGKAAWPLLRTAIAPAALPLAGALFGWLFAKRPDLFVWAAGIATAGIAGTAAWLGRGPELGLALPRAWLHALWPCACAGLLGWIAVHYGRLLVVSFGPEILQGTALITGASRPNRLFCLALLAPAAEELLFRGLIQGRLKELWSPPVAVLVASLLFAIIHLNPLTFPLLLALGLSAGLAREASGSLYPAIAFHAIYNGIVLL